MSQEAFLRDFDAAAMTALAAAGGADAATYTAPGGDPVDCTVTVDHGTQVFGGDDPSGVVGNRTVVRLQLVEIPAPVRGGVVQVGARTYTLDREVEREPGVSMRWVVIHG